jgi:pimeloyl-ACP methyl ester carboxylesterase
MSHHGRGDIRMNVFRRTMAALAGLLLTCGVCRAQDPVSVWSVWETAAVERRGPASAAGLLLYFHGYAGLLDITQFPMSQLFVEMATVAGWDVLRINRLPTADLEPDDDNILRFVTDRITMARQVGYKRIIVAGGSRGGWLALLAATLPGVDAAIATAPGTGSYSTEGLEQTRDRLAQRLTGAKARRIAAFFFDGDAAEDVPERRAVAIRRALQDTRSAFLVVDRPVDFYGHSAAARAGFIRRYLGCLREFAESTDPPAGEVQCSFPASAAAPRQPASADPSLAPFWGHWQGTDETGAYLTLRAVAIRAGAIVFQVVHSDRPAGGFEEAMGERAFELDTARRRIFCRLGKNLDLLFATPKSATELDVELIKSDATGSILGRSRAVLRKQSEEAAR